MVSLKRGILKSIGAEEHFFHVANEQKRERVYLGKIRERILVLSYERWKTRRKKHTVTWINYDAENKIIKYDVYLEFPEITDKKSALFKGCSNVKNKPLKSHGEIVKHQRFTEAKI